MTNRYRLRHLDHWDRARTLQRQFLEKRPLEQLPTWLAAAVIAAGITAYADGLDREAIRHAAARPAGPASIDEPTPPLA